MFLISEVYSGARALLNDMDGAVFTDEVLIPYYRMAMDKLRLDCEENQIPFNFKTSAPIEVAQGVTDIGGPTGPALPRDLVEVLECWEIPSGTGDDYMLMRHTRFLPKTPILTSYLEVWTWQNDYIHFLGANGNIQVKIDYLSDPLGDLTAPEGTVRLTNSKLYLQHSTAAWAAQFIGENESRATALADMASQFLSAMINIKIMSQQNMATRRRPFMANYKLRQGQYGR